MQTTLPVDETKQDVREARKTERRVADAKSERDQIRITIKNAKERAARAHARLAKLGLDPDKCQAAVAAIREAGVQPPPNYAPAKFIEILEDVESTIRDADDRLMRLVAECLGDNDGNSAYTPADIAAWSDRSAEMGASRPVFPQYQLEALIRMNTVPNAPLREAVLAQNAFGHLTASLGQHTQHVARMLGIATDHSTQDGKSYHGRTIFLSYEVACEIARHLGLAPHQVGV